MCVCVCVCNRQGYEGERCQFETSGCAPFNPCFRGTCQELGRGNYRCNCQPGFTGSKCETDVDECLSQPCQNGATCFNGAPGTFQCRCPVCK